ncbi:homeotic protein distal-less-like [Rhinatrema bivittatum]|uniref:homeotic protein distal-less-like n=1 Tax=Rhinatrema bivittatum TaxID=194408 RepID=UPI0011266930|nr:homeotic protein distal-less-like [Rhinatrema bivittatum]
MPVYQTCPGDPGLDLYWSPQSQGSAAGAGPSPGQQGEQSSGWPSGSSAVQGPHSSRDPCGGSPLGQLKVQAERRGKPGKSRTVFSQEQLLCLHQRFQRQRYLTPAQIQELSQEQALSYKQVKTWFQNQRMKQKRCQKGNIWLGKNIWLAQKVNKKLKPENSKNSKAAEHGSAFSSFPTGFAVPGMGSANPQALMVSQPPNYTQQGTYPAQTSYQQHLPGAFQHATDYYQPYSCNNPGLEYAQSRQGEAYSPSPTPAPFPGASLLYPQQLGAGHHRHRGPEQMPQPRAHGGNNFPQSQLNMQLGDEKSQPLCTESGVSHRPGRGSTSARQRLQAVKAETGSVGR